MRKRKMLLCAFAAGVLLVMPGCAPANIGANENTTINKTEEEVMLNARQIEILTAKELPTNYGELNAYQKHAIVAIEDMLCYLEKKYDKTFYFVNYDGPGNEMLVAECDDASVKVYRSYQGESYRYSDNYMELCASPFYQQELQDYLCSKCGEGNCLIFSEVTRVDENITLSSDGIIGKASARSDAFISDSIGQQAFRTLISEYTEWIQANANGHECMVTFYLTESEKMGKLHSYNYIQLEKELTFEEKTTCSLSSSGSMNIF